VEATDNVAGVPDEEELIVSNLPAAPKRPPIPPTTVVCPAGNVKVRALEKSKQEIPTVKVFAPVMISDPVDPLTKYESVSYV
jgi:hypothetical protein